MPIRNPFARRTATATAHDESLYPEQDASHPGFERVDTIGSKASSALSIRSNRSHDTGEYKMSAAYIFRYVPALSVRRVLLHRDIKLIRTNQPSPTQDKGQWPRKYLSSRASTETGSSLGDIEHFPISRESFDSYRRSFDITARSPVISHDGLGRQSLDSARFRRLPRSAIDRKFECEPPTAEEGFEDVGLDDHKQQPRKRGFFAKLTESQDANGQPTVPRFLIPGRKRGQSGQGSELGTMNYPRTSDEARN
ncbi:uncharacterized protein MAM_02006 [Metarhizium album ARSEF 1941]|uniref:Uncharacterized protein n=1 Tax=Metarhizium album (strain ARSEF 1941) TaxID=1081103 RepID=A0A0B2X2V2_METAS|nr:uncharacterized protein MAM_02006 [Metarhizium album ARSEF 1941]KHO00083.1 hypothetical protein MAM_02006 [Metarhizium album ARSEF 1941]